MSAAAVDPATPALASPVRGGKKKLIVLLAAVLAGMLIAGGGAVFYLKHKASEAGDDVADEGIVNPHKTARSDPSHPPTFLPLDVFVVNLADKDVGRYAQVGITLEVDSALFAEQMKAYMPAIRNAILMILAHKNSHELLERSGKEQLAEEIMREAVRPMGIDIRAPDPILVKVAEGTQDDGAEGPAPKAKPGRGNPHNPVRHVHFSNFIVQ